MHINKASPSLQLAIEANKSGAKVLHEVPYVQDVIKSGVGSFNFTNSSMPPITEASTDSSDRHFAVLDIESTGFDPELDSPFEIGIVRCSYNVAQKKITGMLGALTTLEAPSKAIPEAVEEITGITNEHVHNQLFHEVLIDRYLQGIDFVVAHNASFDRAFFDKRFPQYRDRLVWACSSKGGDIDWAQLGANSTGLDYLLFKAGYHFKGHRAAVDCVATAWLLTVVDGAFEQLLDSVSLPAFVIEAQGAPFHAKDALKRRGYNWKSKLGVWAIRLSGESKRDAELNALNNLYEFGARKAKVTELKKTRRHLNN